MFVILSQADAADRALFPPDAWFGQLFLTPRPLRVHRFELASTNHIQMSGNASAGRHKSRKVCHRSRRRVGRTPASSALFSASVKPSSANRFGSSPARNSTSANNTPLQHSPQFGQSWETAVGMVWLHSLAQIIACGQSRRVKFQRVTKILRLHPTRHWIVDCCNYVFRAFCIEKISTKRG